MIRHQVRLTSPTEAQRPRLISDFISRLELLLDEAYPARERFVRATTWTRAKRPVGTATDEQLERCRDASILLTREQHWGVSVDVTPQDYRQQLLWLRVAAAPPRVERLRRWALGAGTALGVAVALIAEIIWWNSGWRPEDGKMLLALPGWGALAGSGLSLTAANLVRMTYERRFAADLARVNALLTRAWQSLSTDYAGLPAMQPRYSPTLRNAAITVALALAAALSYWSFWAIAPTTSVQWALMMSIGIAGVVAGFGAFCFAMITFFDFVGVEIYGAELKTGD